MTRARDLAEQYTARQLATIAADLEDRNRRLRERCVKLELGLLSIRTGGFTADGAREEARRALARENQERT